MLRNRSLMAISLVVAVTFIGAGMVVPVPSGLLTCASWEEQGGNEGEHGEALLSHG